MLTSKHNDMDETLLANLREDYTRGGLSEADALADPVDQFRQWFEQALAAKLIEPNAMTLATVDADGMPNARTVLLKAYDQRGFVFFTNYDSTKAQEIAASGKACLLFPWLGLERQVKIRGSVEKISTAESLKYFLSRPFGSRLGAWVSHQSQVISSRQVLEAKLEQIKAKFSKGEVPLPSFWGGYRICPQTFEFWQGRTGRLHDRLQYSRKPGGNEQWVIERLAP